SKHERHRAKAQAKAGRLLQLVASILFIQSGWLSRCARLKHARASSLAEMDRWIRVRLRSILRKRAGRRGKGRGLDHHRWPNNYFAKLGIFNLEAAQKLELMSLLAAANF
ncbi:MAG: hypothetical protein Q8M07_09895, partial [Prosthecobacter sp.]|nr:hypothetical protein [Prosthecobacter sp.]